MANLLERLRIRNVSGGNYAYVTARVRAKKAQLLPKDQYQKLLVRDLPEIARALQEGEYKQDIDELAARYRGAELIERATRRHLGRVYAQIQGFSTGILALEIAAYLGRYDVYNVKTVLRGKFAAVPPEQILSETIPAGTLAPRLEELARAERMEDVAEALRGTPWGALITAQVEGRTVDNLIDIENSLDRAYYNVLVSSIPKTGRANRILLSWVQNEIDLLNVKTLFRLRFAGVTDWEPYFLADGKEVDRDTATRIVRGTDDEVVQEIAQLSVASEVVDATRESLRDRNVSAVATALDKELVRDASDFGHRAPLSVLPVIDFILRKKIEADNLRAIAYGKQTNLPSDVIKELLVL